VTHAGALIVVAIVVVARVLVAIVVVAFAVVGVLAVVAFVVLATVVTVTAATRSVGVEVALLGAQRVGVFTPVRRVRGIVRGAGESRRDDQTGDGERRTSDRCRDSNGHSAVHEVSITGCGGVPW
jgi:hypothetical protein